MITGELRLSSTAKLLHLEQPFAQENGAFYSIRQMLESKRLRVMDCNHPAAAVHGIAYANCTHASTAHPCGRLPPPVCDCTAHSCERLSPKCVAVPPQPLRVVRHPPWRVASAASRTAWYCNLTRNTAHPCGRLPSTRVGGRPCRRTSRRRARRARGTGG